MEDFDQNSQEDTSCALNSPFLSTPVIETDEPTPILCEECEDRAPVWRCRECGQKDGGFCDVCYHTLHRKGKRLKHDPVRLRPEAENSGSLKSNFSSFARTIGNAVLGSNSPGRDSVPSKSDIYDRNSFVERSKYIPLRLTLEERQYLRLVESAIGVSDYTGAVDRDFKNASLRQHKQLEHISLLLGGLVLGVDFDRGKEVMEERDFSVHEEFFQDMFEIARRHKIMNPEKMRTEYGKMVYLLQDACCGPASKMLNVNMLRGIKTVYTLLKEKGGTNMLRDSQMELATKEILPDARKSRSAIDKEIKLKERAVAYLKRSYSSPTLTEEEIHTCLYSICDNDSFLNSNRLPIDKMIVYLKRYFSPGNIREGYSLAIVAGEEGARLTHSHERQFNFAYQSLTLWREIVHDMFRLWCLAEMDLLSTTDTYCMVSTGQGNQRVQPCPRTFKAMHEILYHTQREVKNWVGSSVIHLGDKNVPNSLIFIDKYTQVSRILSPIVSCLEQVAKLGESENDISRVCSLIDHGYGGVEKLTLDILHDFFRCAFDGSGADNFYEAGSCIDGRLTSAWNWCSQLSSKPYYPIFKLTGFTGFDGDFQK